MRDLFDAGAIMGDLGNFYRQRGTLIDPNAAPTFSTTGQRKAATGAPIDGLEDLPCEIAPLKGTEVVSNRPGSSTVNPSSQTLLISTHRVAFSGRYDEITETMVFSVASGPYTGTYEITRVNHTGLQTVLEVSKVK